MIKIKIKTLLASLALISILSTSANSTEECFEGLSRSIFKFNLAFDDMVLEPIAKGYNKLPDPTVLEILPQIFLLFYTKFFSSGNIKQFGHATGSVLVNTMLEYWVFK